MKNEARTLRVETLDVSPLPVAERFTASALQGLVNRAARAGEASRPFLFLDYGVYDDPASRRTNQVMMTEEDWFGRYRDVLKENDRDLLGWYAEDHAIANDALRDLDEAVSRHLSLLSGFVVWDPALVETLDAALVLAGLEDLLVVHPDREAWASGFGLERRQDLRGRFTDRVALFEWALAELRPRCAPGAAAAFEPAWNRPEFADYIVKERLFTFSLSSYEKGGLRDSGHTILALLAAGPRGLRSFIFGLRLDGLLRRLALRLLRAGSRETALMLKALASIEAKPYPTLFGWHVDRDDELSFMLLISAAGTRLVPSFMASNYSFHSSVPAAAVPAQAHLAPGSARLERDKVYLSFTLSDGDQLALMDTAELGGFRRPERGSVPFNWEVQPLLAEFAPALLSLYVKRLTPADLLVAGPSGAGYVIPPLVPDLPAYVRESALVCAKAGIRVVTSYIGDPPRRVLRDLGRGDLGRDAGILGYLSGYFHLGFAPVAKAGDKPFVANAWPHVDKILASKEETLEGIRAFVEAPGPTPRFIGCHLFAYRTNVADVAAFVATLDAAKVKVVRADELLAAAAEASKVYTNTDLLSGLPAEADRG